MCPNTPGTRMVVAVVSSAKLSQFPDAEPILTAGARHESIYIHSSNDHKPSILPSELFCYSRLLEFTQLKGL